ncbi:MAG: CotH kinase family protein [Lachnospiraceae bacterium]|nr:CotH kinase family protein [Lachnospiraceae bacterium]
MKKRPVWIGCLIIAFACCVLLFHVVDNMEFCGLRVQTEEWLEAKTAEMHFVDKPENVDELIQLDGQRIPYDRSGNTFYVSQSTEAAEYAGTFQAMGDNCEIYIQRDEALGDKQSAIAQGHVFKLWFLTADTCTTANLVFSGLPVLSIGAEADSLTAAYAQGDMVVYNPDDTDINGMSVKQSAVTVKQNENTGTITFRLYKKAYKEERNLSLLGLGKHTSWKLYQVSEKDDTFVRTLLSVYVWNGVCGDESLQRGMGLAEVIVNDRYAGLYYLAPKAGKGFLGLQETDRIYECEDMLEDGTQVFEVVGDEDIPENYAQLDAYQSVLADLSGENISRIDLDNYINYHIYLQAVCGIRNSQEEYYVIAQNQGNGYLYRRWPEPTEYVWGLYPSRIGWQSLTAAENIMEDEAYHLIVEQDASVAAYTTERWNELRQSVLSTEVLTQAAYAYEKRLADGGYIVREAQQETYNDSCGVLQDMIIKRMDYLDSYFNGS